jgi:hypothetical protein
MRRVFFVDYAVLGLQVDLVRAAVGRLPASPLYRLVPSHLHSLRPGHEELRTTVPGAALAAASIELVRTLVTTAAEPDTPQEGSAHHVLRMRVADYIERNLADAERADNRAGAQRLGPAPLRRMVGQPRAAPRVDHPRPPGTGTQTAGHRHATSRCHGGSPLRFRDTYGIPPRQWQRQFVGRS